MLATATDKSANTVGGDKSIKQVTMKEVLPKQMEKLQGLKKWPIIMDEIGKYRLANQYFRVRGI